MDSSLNYLLKRDGDDRGSKESDFCGPLHRSGDCSYINCSYTVDHYHCQICGNGAVEASQALYHIRSSPSCRRDSQHSQYLNESTSSLHVNAYNTFYGSLTAQNSLCSSGPLTTVPITSGPLTSGYSGYGQVDSFQWHAAVPVDKMAICGPQLSPCFSASNNSRIPIDPSICSPISDLYSKATGVIKDLVSLPAKSTGIPSDSQPWFYSNQPMQVYKYVEQTSVPQINFLLLDPPIDHKEGTLSSDILPAYSYSNKSECNSSQREKESFLPFCSQQSLAPVSSDDPASLFTLQIQDENLNSKQTDLFSNEQISASSICAQECSSKSKDGDCCMLIAGVSGSHNTDLASFTEFESGNISDEEHSSGSESDIIVEDTTDQLTDVAQSQMSIETIKCSLLEEVENVRQKNNENFSSMAISIAKSTVSIGENIGCAVCNDNSPGSVLIQLGSQLPVTSTSNSPVLLKLSHLVNLNASEVVNTLGGLLCQRCLSLIDAVDSLESQLESARQNILQMFRAAIKSGGVILTANDCLSNARNEMHQLQSGTIAPECPKVDKTQIIHQVELVESYSEKESAADKNGESLQESSGNQDQSVLQETKNHRKIQDDKEKFEFFCSLCASGFATLSELNLHFALHKQRDTKFLCEVCGRRFKYRHQHQIDQHLAQHFPESLFPCSECDKSFKSKRALQEHRKVHSGDRPFSCPNCDRRFAHSSNMRSHFKLCSGDLPFRCDKCKAGFSVLARLERHLALAHSGLAAFKCAQCNRTFSKLSDFRAHQRVHSTLRTFACAVCDRSYKSLSNLNQHAKSHRKEKPFNCDICGQGFLRKDSWGAHMLSHKNERPFKCTECPKAFWSKENLSMHTKRHAGTHKKNKCPVCEKTFSQKLSIHMRTHTGDRPYRCNKCDKAFSTGSSLNKHVLVKHSNTHIFI